jgi:RNA polymerase sigma-70 factor (ECF subfamily)
LAKSGARLPSEEGALEAYFKGMAVNAARDWGRRRGADKRSQDVTVPIESHLHELAGQIRGGEPMEREILVRQIEERLAGSRRDVAVFWLYYRQGLSAPEIAAIPAVGLSVKGVESLIHRMVGSLRERLK